MSVSRNGAEPVASVSVEGGDLPPGSAQLNAEFLCDLGLLIEEAPGKYKPTAVAMQFINTLAGDESRGRRLLRSLIAKLWFAKSAATVLQDRSATTPSELIGALAQEGQALDREGEKSIAVLVDYLTYTGITVPTEGGLSLGPGSSVQGRYRSPAPLTARPQPPKEPIPVAPPTVDSKAEQAGWRAIRTDDFDLKIRAESRAVSRLRKHLDLLDEELSSRTT